MMMMEQVLPSKYQSEELIAKFPVHEEQKESSKYLVHTLACFVTLFGLCLVFASNVLRITEPKIEMKSAKMMHLSYSINSPSYASFINVTMIVSVKIINPNYGHFSYHNSSVKFLYGVISFGERGIVGSRVEGRDSKEFNVMVNARFNNNKEVRLIRENVTNNIINSGVMKIKSYAELSGVVQVLKIVSKRKNIVMACIMALNFTSHSIQHFQFHAHEPMNHNHHALSLHPPPPHQPLHHPLPPTPTVIHIVLPVMMATPSLSRVTPEHPVSPASTSSPLVPAPPTSSSASSPRRRDEGVNLFRHCHWPCLLPNAFQETPLIVPSKRPLPTRHEHMEAQVPLYVGRGNCLAA
ncbi:hypothetical protein PIB30_000652 [Stylosanthes scabra]|uniref:Late embryogenesis abundant protein LEA-2 subgroup domain-containing protein n=1 Tax=Stylosanthes scabra TaxID=79078 RepID=A0ABU6Y0Y8_9FABA|nr:hypothetical protein [Stylosanthes scabra]